MTRDPHATGADEVERLLADCLALPDSEVSAAIDAACARRPDLARELSDRFRALAELGLAPWGNSSRRPAAALPERFGEFRLIARLGEGGMGVVYRARQESLGREIALKIVRPELLWFAKTRERFRREAEAIARLDHPGIVPVFQIGEESGIPFFVMPLLSGGTLADLLSDLEGRAPERLSAGDVGDSVRRRAGGAQVSRSASSAAPWDRPSATYVEVVTRLATSVARTLDHVHRRGIVHRDVKPSNIAITPDGRALLLDFGLRASLFDAEQFTASGAMLGTPAYMAPEQIADPRAAHAGSDVWSLGVTLWQLLALQTPFVAEGGTAMWDAARAGRREPLRARNRSVPADLATVLDKALDPESRHRYGSAAEFADDLEAVLEGRPIRARPPTPLSTALRWCRRHKARATAIGASVLLVLGLPTALFVQQKFHAIRLQRTLGERNAALSAESAAKATAVQRLRGLERTLDYVEGVFSGALVTDDRWSGVLVKAAAAAVADFPGEPGIRGRVLHSNGRILDRLGLDREARHAFENAVAAFEEAGPSDRVSLAATETSLALAILRTGAVENARPHAERSLEILRSDPTADASNLAGALAANAAIDANLGELERAEARYRAALDVERRGPDAKPRDIAIHRANLGTVLLRRGRMEEAAEELREAIPSLRDSPEDRLDLVAALNGLALVDKTAGHFDAARTGYEEALSILEVRGLDSGQDAAILSMNLGLVLEKLARPDEGIERARAACAILDRALDAGAPTRVTAHLNVADMLGRANRLDEADAEAAIAESLVRTATPPTEALLRAVEHRKGQLAALRRK